MGIHRRWGPYAAALILLLTTAGRAQNDALLTARKALDAGEPEAAVKALQAAAGAADPALKGELAEAQLAAGQHDEALKTATAASAATPSNPDAARALALVQAGRFEFDDALKAVDQSLQRNPGNGGLLAAQGRVLWQLRRTKSAIEALTAATKDTKVAGEAQYWLGRIYQFRGTQSEGAYPGFHEEVEFRDDAAAAFKAAAQARPAWYGPRVGLGNLRLAEGDAAGALAAFDEAIQRGPNVAGARVGRWRALKELNRTAEIQPEVAQAAQSSDPRLVGAAREGYVLLGMEAEAQALATRLAQEFPKSPAVQAIAAARITGIRNQPATVIEQATAFIREHPFSAQLPDVYGALLAAYQATPSAPIEAVVSAIDGNIKHRPDPGGYAAGANILLARRTMLDKAIQLAEAGLGATTTFINENLGSYKMEGKYTGALARSRSTTADLVGWALFLKGDSAGAEPRLNEAERLSRGLDVANQIHLGELRRAKGELDLAREHFLNALTLAGGPAPLREAAKKSLADVHVKLGNEAAEFEGYLAAELERRREERRTSMLHSMVGQTAPDLKVLDLNGKQVDLKAERGNVVLLNFFASW